MVRIVPIIFVALLSPSVFASHTEQRYFSIFVDGKETGEAKLTVVEQDNNSAYVTLSAHVKVNGFIRYNMQLEVQEWWKDGRLVGYKSACDDNGRKCDLLAAQVGAALRVRVNGQERDSRTDIWPSSFWKLIDFKQSNRPVTILASDSGEERTAQLQFLGQARLTVANLPVSCYHFRISGAGQPIDLWFDQHHRLVRQEFTQAGHKTIIQLLSKR